MHVWLLLQSTRAKQTDSEKGLKNERSKEVRRTREVQMTMKKTKKKKTKMEG